jgi:hypothetical protein
VPWPGASPCAGSACQHHRVGPVAEQEQRQEQRARVAGAAGAGMRTGQQEERGGRRSEKWTGDELTGYY